MLLVVCSFRPPSSVHRPPTPGSSNGRMRRSDRRDAGSSPAPGSNWFNHVAVTGRATAAPAKRVDAGSSPARNSTYGDSTRVQMILARSSRPERYRLSPPIFLRCPRSSTDRAPSFYLGTVRVRVLPRAPPLQPLCVHVAQMDQSGDVRSLRLRVRIAPWTPLLVTAIYRQTESWPSGKAPRC